MPLPDNEKRAERTWRGPSCRSDPPGLGFSSMCFRLSKGGRLGARGHLQGGGCGRPRLEGAAFLARGGR